jgi:hypothetical protein
MKSQYIIMFNSFDNTGYKAFKGLYLDMQHAHAECKSQRLEPTVQTVDTWRKLPLPADMRKRLNASANASANANEFFPEKIQHHILNAPSVAVTYRFNAGGRRVVLHFVVFNKRKSDLNMSKMLERARRVCALVHLVSLHASRSTCSSELCIYIYLTEFKKRFPTRKGETLDAEHVNTGMSYHCARDNDVVVYRKEEWFKVLIHELFHALGLSFIESDVPSGVHDGMQRALQRMYAISHPVRVYETYCEIWARILNAVFDCFTEEVGRDARDLHLRVFMECVLQRLHADATFAHAQCGKLLHYMDLTHDNIANPTPTNRALVAEKYRENTNVFAYYVLTCILMHSVDDYMAWCYKNNPFRRSKPRPNVLQFRTLPSNFNGFMELLNHCRQRCPAFTPELVGGDADVLGSSMCMTRPHRVNEKIDLN